jgi:membrane-associated phospholipid phosphatase
MTNAAPFLAWPGRDVLNYFLRRGIAITILWVVVYGGADLITGWRHLRFRVHFDWELAIPFVPAAVLAYVSVNLLFLLAPFVLRDRQSLNAYAKALAAEILIAGLCFLILPSELAFDHSADAGGWSTLLTIARTIALHYNLVPSLHVAMAVSSVAAFATRGNEFVRGLLWAWALAIAASTLLTHQHHLIDVVAGWLLGIAAKRFIFDRADRPIPSTDPETPA